MLINLNFYACIQKSSCLIWRLPALKISGRLISLKSENNKKIWKNYLSRNQLLQLKKQKSKIQHQRWRKQVKGKILKNLRIEDKTKLFILTKKLLKQVFSILKAINRKSVV